MQNRAIKWMLTLCMLVLPGCALAHAFGACPDDTPELSTSQHIDLFDPQRDPAEKLPLVEMLRSRAAAGCLEAQYALGNLLRFGDEMPGNPLTKDTQTAAGLIEAYGRHGNIRAYADLAEMALAAEDGRAAMLWTQVYLHFATRHQGALTTFDRRGYNANLLLRAIRAARSDGLNRKRDIEAMLADYLAKHREEILSAADPDANHSGQGKQERASAEPPDLVVETRPPTRTIALGIDAGYAAFLLEVQPDGRVSRIVPESFAPTPRHAARLKPLVEGFIFKPFDWHEPQIARVPAEYGYDDAYSPSLKR